MVSKPSGMSLVRVGMSRLKFIRCLGFTRKSIDQNIIKSFGKKKIQIEQSPNIKNKINLNQFWFEFSCKTH